MTDVFLSYKREDHVRVDRLAALLTECGLEVWYDASLLGGVEWPAKLESVARAAKLIVVCWTDAAAASGWVQKEVAIGLERKVLLPVRFAECALPMGLGALHFPDLSDWSDGSGHRGLLQFAASLDARLGSSVEGKLRERAGGENLDVVARLRAMLVEVARSGGPPVSYDRAFECVADTFADGQRTPRGSLYGALDSIAEQNRQRREPPLFALVVKGDGLPGVGYFQKHCFLSGYDKEANKWIHDLHLQRVYRSSWPNDP